MVKQTVGQIVKGSKFSNFDSYREGIFYYTTDQGFKFIVPLLDISGATLNAQEKTIYFMRWIRQQVDFINSNVKGEHIEHIKKANGNQD